MSVALLDDPVDLSEVDGVPATSEGGFFEYVDGVGTGWPPVSPRAEIAGQKLGRFMANFTDAAGIGLTVTETQIRLDLPVDRRRRPDIAYVPYSVWAEDRDHPDTDGWAVTPAFCAEIVSPSDNAEQIEDKVEEYFRAGVQLVWVIYPRHRFTLVYDNSGGCRRVNYTEELEGGAAVPGFKVVLADLFPKRGCVRPWECCQFRRHHPITPVAAPRFP